LTSGITRGAGQAGLVGALPSLPTAGAQANGGLPSLGGAGLSSGGPLPDLTGAGSSIVGGGPVLGGGDIPATGQTDQQQIDPTTGQPVQIDPTTGQPVQQPGTAPAGTDPAAMLDPAALMGKFKWLGPAMVVGGAALGAFALIKWGSQGGKLAGMLAQKEAQAAGEGIAAVAKAGEFNKLPMIKLLMAGSMVASGLYTTMTGFEGAGKEAGKEEGVRALQQALAPEMQKIETSYDATMQENEQLKQLIAQYQAQGQVPGAGTTTPGTGQQIAPGSGGTTTPGTGGATTPGPDGTTAGSGTQTTATPRPAGQWSSAGLLGKAVSLGQATAPTGFPVAEQGSYAIGSTLGDPAGYATVDEASTVAQASMSTELQGTKLYRWVVIEHDGRYYAVQAAKDDTGTAGQLAAADGTIAAWHALRFDETGAGAWTAYHWSKTAGSSFTPFVTTGGGGNAAAQASSAGSAGGTTADPVSNATSNAIGAATGTPAAGAQPAVSGGGAATASVSQPAGFDPASLVGTGFAVSDAAIDGTTVAGGFLQLRKLVVLSEGGLSSPAAAGDVARRYRESNLEPNGWQRWVTVKANDGRYYVYEGTIVNAATAALPATAAPMHLFGHGFAEYFDGRSWVASRD
jgi:hypothetical protein